MKIFLCLFLILSLNAKELKTAFLIITTDDQPAYIELQKIWQIYMNSDLNHFEAYFLRANPELENEYVIHKNEIIVKTREGLVPGILNKTILGMKALKSRLDEFDYVIRTNLSSFFPFENLLKYLDKLPRERCYAGIAMYQPANWGHPPELGTIPFISGAGIILSKDMVKLMLENHEKLEAYKKTMPDDVFIGLFYQKESIPTIPAQRWDYPTYESWVKHHHKIEDYAYHFRAKSGYNFRTNQDPFGDELLTLKALLKKYYPML